MLYNGVNEWLRKIEHPMIRHEDLKKNVSLALAEDIGNGDLTASLVPADKMLTARVISREQAIICGTAWFEECFRQLSPSIEISWLVQDGETVRADQLLCEMTGNARALLTAERTALNFLQLLSAVATHTRRYVDAVSGTSAVIVDTRKTLPGLRYAQKYAVACGGGVNHRFGLYDGMLIKENHIIAAGGIVLALHQAKQIAPVGVSIQIEVETPDELQQALAAGASMILLDNFDLEMLRQAVTFNRRRTDPRAILEASGNITLANVHAVAQTGVDRISIGSLTKDIKALDLSMRFLSVT